MQQGQQSRSSMLRFDLIRFESSVRIEEDLVQFTINFLKTKIRKGLKYEDLEFMIIQTIH